MGKDNNLLYKSYKNIVRGHDFKNIYMCAFSENPEIITEIEGDIWGYSEKITIWYRNWTIESLSEEDKDNFYADKYVNRKNW